MDKNKGELMHVANFGALQGLTNLRPQDYINYLNAVSGQSKRIVFPQFHATISAKGRELSKKELTELAVKWLNGMGYGENPYMLVYHKDTANNHIHMVSTRIGPDGKKINDSYEKVRAYKVLNNLIGLNETNEAAKDISQALTYGFSSRAQFMMLLEVKGYALSLKDGHYQVFKFGKEQNSLPVEKVDQRIGDYQLKKERLQQLRVIVEKYRSDHSPELIPKKSKLPGGGEGKVTGYTSELSDMLHQKFGLQIFFHAKDGKPPYGYTVIDHAQKAVYKGGELMPLAEFIQPVHERIQREKTAVPPHNRAVPDFESQEELLQGLPDESDNYISSEEIGEYPSVFIDYTTTGGFVPPLRLDISDDIDDEQINGRNRRRKRKARTNTR
jgi:hypothetical protein